MQPNDPVQFLRAILPEAGHYIAWVKKPAGGSFNAVFDTIEELAAFIARADAAGNEVYHACASYQHRDGVWNAKKEKMEVRAQANAWGARALWLDVDAGDGKPYPHAGAAAEAVVLLAQQIKLPPPLFVGSGYGLHCYWPLDTALNPADWLRLATGLRNAAQQHGLAIDAGCTTDIARVLRTPGTHNRKHSSAMPVVAGPLVGPYQLDNFLHLLALSSAASVPVAKPAVIPAEVSTLTSAITDGTHDPLYADNVADGCAQVAQFRSSNNRYGPVLEPHWYACVGVTTWCVDAAEKTHAWSSAHPNYSPAETDDRLRRARQLTGATTCQKFQSLNPAGCASCSHQGKIKSPISLGYGPQSNHLQVQASAPLTLSNDTPSSVSLSTAFSPITRASTSTPPLEKFNSQLTVAQRELFSAEPLPQLQKPWRLNSAGQLVMEIEDDGESAIALVCNYPTFLAGVQTGEVGEGAYSYHFRQFLPHMGWSSIVVPAEVLMGPGGIARLYGKGIVVHDQRAFNSYVRDAVDGYNAAEKLRTRFDQFGWKGDSFLYGSRLYGATAAPKEMLGSDEVKERSAWLKPKAGGSLPAWSAAANALFQSGCEVQAFALLCSFAAPLMRYHTTTEGGAIVALHSRGSAKGKSTALAAVSSVWGDKKGLELTNTDTGVSKGITLGVLGNLPVVYDEMQDKDPEAIRDFVRIFTNGRDKMRGTTAGNIKHTQSSWQTILISASNASLTDTLYSEGTDALSFRVLELPNVLPPNIDTTKGDGLKKALEHNCGYAGDAFLRYLVQPEVLSWSRTAIESWTAELWAKTKLGTEHRFRVRLLGSVAVAAALVNKLGLLAFDPQRILNWATDRLIAGRNSAPITGHDADTSAEALAAYLSENLADTLVMPRAYEKGDRVVLPLLLPLRRLTVRLEKANGRLLIAQAPLRAWLLRKQIAYQPFMEDLVEAKVVTAAERKATLSAGTDLPGGQMVCIEVNALHLAVAGVLDNVVHLADVRQQGLANVAK